MSLDICRLCLLSNKNRKSISEVSQLIEEVSGVVVEDNSGKICESCHSDLIRSWRLRRRIQLTDRIFRAKDGVDEDIPLLSQEQDHQLHLKLACHECNEFLPVESLPQHIQSLHSDHVDNCPLCSTIKTLFSSKVEDFSDEDQTLLDVREDSESEPETPRLIKKQKVEPTRHKCPKCDLSYARKEKLKIHIQNVHKNVKPKARPATRESLNKSHSPQEDNDSSEDVPVHFSPNATVATTIASGSVRYVCRECKKTFRERKQLKEHLLEEHKFEQVLDQLPITEASNSLLLDETMNQKPFGCHVCDKSYGKTYQLADHLRTKHKIVWLRKTDPRVGAADYQPFACKFCGKEFRFRKTLRLHLKNCSSTDKEQVEDEDEEGEKNSSKPKFVCPTCGMTCSAIATFDAHLLKHSAEPFPCSICDAGFANRLKRKDHEVDCSLLKATGCISFHCTACGEKMDRVTDLKEHRRMCESKAMEVSLLCKSCGDSFKDAKGIFKHLNEAHQLITCSECEKSYMNTVQLKTHFQKTHKTNRSLICTICGSQLSRPDKLVEHMWTHTGFACSLCDVSFASRKEAQQHRKEKHPKRTKIGKGEGS